MTDDLKRRTALAVIEIRRRLDMTGTQFAEALRSRGATADITKISQWENGVQTPRGSTLLAMFEVAGLWPPEGRLNAPIEDLARQVARLLREGEVEEGLLTIRQAADRYGISKQALHRHIKEGNLPVVPGRVLRVRDSDVRRLRRK